MKIRGDILQIAVCAVAAFAVVVAWNHFIPMDDPSPVVLSPLSPDVGVIAAPSAPAATPITDVLTVALAVLTGFLTMLAMHADFGAPVHLVLARRRDETLPRLAAIDYIRAVLLPTVSQPALRAGVLGGGVIGIFLWHMGADTFQVLPKMTEVGAICVLTFGMAVAVLSGPDRVLSALWQWSMRALNGYIVSICLLDTAQWAVALTA